MAEQPEETWIEKMRRQISKNRSVFILTLPRLGYTIFRKYETCQMHKTKHNSSPAVLLELKSMCRRNEESSNELHCGGEEEESERVSNGKPEMGEWFTWTHDAIMTCQSLELHGQTDARPRRIISPVSISAGEITIDVIERPKSDSKK